MDNNDDTYLLDGDFQGDAEGSLAAAVQPEPMAEASNTPVTAALPASNPTDAEMMDQTHEHPGNWQPISFGGLRSDSPLPATSASVTPSDDNVSDSPPAALPVSTALHHYYANFLDLEEGGRQVYQEQSDMGLYFSTRDPQADYATSANLAAISLRLNIPPEDIGEFNYPVWRNHFALINFGKSRVTDTEFFTLNKQRAEAQQSLSPPSSANTPTDYAGIATAASSGVGRGSSGMAGGVALAAVLEVPNAALAAATGLFAPVTFAGLNAAEFIAGAYGGSKVYDAVQAGVGMLFPKSEAARKQMIQDHPVAEQVGEQIPTAIQGVQSIRNLSKLAATQPTVRTAVTEVGKRLFGSAVGGAATEAAVRPVVEKGINYTEAWITGNPEKALTPVTLRSVLDNAALGMLLSHVKEGSKSSTELENATHAVPKETLQNAANDPQWKEVFPEPAKLAEKELSLREGEITKPIGNKVFASPWNEKTVPVIKIQTSKLSGTKQNWHQNLRRWIGAKLQGQIITNKRSGFRIKFNAESKAEAVSKLRKEPAFRALKNIKEIVEEGLYLETVPASHTETNRSQAYHWFIVPVEVDGTIYAAWFNVRQPKIVQGDWDAAFYEFGIDLENKMTQLPQGSGPQSGILAPIAGPRINISDFLPKVKGEIAKHIPPPPK